MKKYIKYIILIIILFSVFFLGIVFVNLYVISFSRGIIYSDVKDIPEDYKIGLVFGAHVYNDKPSDILRDRLIVAYNAYIEGEIETIIVSGDNSIKNYNEPVVMKKYLVDLGVKTEDVYIDYAGFDTFDSIYRANYIFSASKLVLFTQEFHIKRALYIAQKLGIDSIGVKTDLNTYVNSGYNERREALARIKAFLDIEILKSKPKFLGDKVIISKTLPNPIFELDMKSDDSITKFVDNRISFNDLEYIPNDLEKVSGEYLKTNNGNFLLREEALDNLLEMSEYFYLKFDEKIHILSTYRSYIYQKGVIRRGCDEGFCAMAGFSEHQSGLAFDIFDVTDIETRKKDSKLQEYYVWLDNNAYNFGFINTYKKGLEIDGYELEPWHWRYVGIELATYLHINNMSFSEFYYFKG